jgi:hypothetical protein
MKYFTKIKKLKISYLNISNWSRICIQNYPDLDPATQDEYRTNLSGSTALVYASYNPPYLGMGRSVLDKARHSGHVTQKDVGEGEAARLHEGGGEGGLA